MSAKGKRLQIMCIWSKAKSRCKKMRSGFKLNKREPRLNRRRSKICIRTQKREKTKLNEKAVCLSNRLRGACERTKRRTCLEKKILSTFRTAEGSVRTVSVRLRTTIFGGRPTTAAGRTSAEK